MFETIEGRFGEASSGEVHGFDQEKTKKTVEEKILKQIKENHIDIIK